MLESPYLEIIAALFGLEAASLLIYAAPRLVAYRLPEPNPFGSRSLLMPVVGPWIARWRPVRSTVVELLTAGVLVALSLRYGPSARLLLSGAYSVLLIAIAYIDVDYRLVLNRLTYPGIVAALAASLLWPGLDPISALVGAVVAMVIFVALQLIRPGALGTGDTKLAILIGAIRGFPGVFDALLLGVILGGLGAVVLLMALRRGRKEYIAYAPYLAVGAILSFFLSSP